MADDLQYTTGAPSMYKDDRGGAQLIPHPVIGIVKDNIDEKHAGRIRVYLTDYGGGDPNNDKNWTTVNYLSPWFGITQGSAGTANEGSFTSNPQSYGFWASAPDIGTRVICVFINGKPTQGYYIGGVPEIGKHFMVPGIAGTKSPVPNDTEASTYGGVPVLPATESNNNNPKNNNSADQANNPKPIHSYQAAIMATQGIIRDPIRGPITSSSMRETPSSVFGMSTPGGPIWEGGYTRSTINAALKGTDNSKLKVIGRTGGHTLVMDDGELFTGKNQLIRLRSAAGHQITMSDDGQVLFITHSNGQSWIELGSAGTIDMYCKNSFNVRTQGDLNLHADLNVNINAGQDIRLNATNIDIQGSKNLTTRAGGDTIAQSVGNFTHMAGGGIGLKATGETSMEGSMAFITGKKINLNTGKSSIQAKTVPAATMTNHVDTQFSSSVGWMNPSQNPVTSVVSRLPTHQPWIAANMGIGANIPDSVASPPSAGAAATNVMNATASAVATSAPSAVTTADMIKTVPVTPDQASVLGVPTTQALVSQNAMDAAKLSDAEKQKAGIIPGAAGLSLNQLENSGILKAGVAIAAGALMARGVPFRQAVSDNSFTGAKGVTNAAQLESSPMIQAQIAAQSINNAGLKMIDAGVITGMESPQQTAGIVNAVHLTSAGEVANNLVDQANARNIVTQNTANGQSATGASAASGNGGGGSNKVANALAAGALAAGVAGSLLSGAGGLPTSLNELGDTLSSGLTSLKDKLGASFAALYAAGQKAFAAVEASFTKLKAGVVNALDGSTPKVPSATEKASNEYASAVTERDMAQIAYLASQRAYAEDGTDANLTAMNEAKSKYDSAVKKVEAASSAFLTAGAGAGTSLLKSVTGAVTGGAIPGADAINAVNAAGNVTASLSNSGVNALPGGAGSMIAITGGTASASIDSLGKSITGAAGALPVSAGAATAALGKLTGGAKDILAQLNSIVSSLTGGAGALIPASMSLPKPTAATASKTAQLLGDPRIPTPPTAPMVASTDTTPEQVDAGVEAKAMALAELNTQQEKLKAIEAQYGDAAIHNDASAQQMIEAQQKVVAQAIQAVATLSG